MTGLEVGLTVAVALLAVVAAAQARSLSAAARRLELLERRLDRRERREAPREQAPDREPDQPVTPVTAQAEPQADPLADPEAGDADGDAVDIRGLDAEGEPTSVPLEATDEPTLVAFLSTTCEICAGLWDRLREGALETEVPGVLPVVVTKDAAVEDVERIRRMPPSPLPVVLSSESWDDYEVPGSPYVMVVSAAPGSVLTEGAVAGWDDLVAMARSVTPAR